MAHSLRRIVARDKNQTPYMLGLCLATLSGFLLLSNISFANQSQDNIPNKDQLDSREQKELDSIRVMKSPRILLVIPYLEHRVSPTEEDFRRDACKYNPKDKSIEVDLLDAINQSRPLAYKKTQGWTNPIIGID